MLALHPEAFTSDAESEAAKDAADYLPGSASSGATAASSCSARGAAAPASARSAASASAPQGAPHRPRHRHDGPARGARRGIGALLLEACIAEARHAGLEMLTLTVTAENAGAVASTSGTASSPTERCARALKIGGRYHDKLHMALTL
jgi:hypothetical protein